MHYVYILQSQANGTLYKGSTGDLKLRFKKHNNGEVFHTAKFRPWIILFYAAFYSKERALLFEKYLKSGSGIAFMRKRIIFNRPVAK